MSIIVIVSGSICKAKSMLKLPELIHLKSSVFVLISPVPEAKKNSTLSAKENRTLVLAIIPELFPFILFRNNPFTRNPSSGKPGTSQARGNMLLKLTI